MSLWKYQNHSVLQSMTSQHKGYRNWRYRKCKSKADPSPPLLRQNIASFHFNCLTTRYKTTIESVRVWKFIVHLCWFTDEMRFQESTEKRSSFKLSPSNKLWSVPHTILQRRPSNQANQQGAYSIVEWRKTWKGILNSYEESWQK